jgi:hypothetical protein
MVATCLQGDTAPRGGRADVLVVQYAKVCGVMRDKGCVLYAIMESRIEKYDLAIGFPQGRIQP